MSTEWKSINRIMIEVSIPETTARRYLSTFNEFFTVKQFNKVKKYRDDAGFILRRIAELYEQKKTTSEIKALLKVELSVGDETESSKEDEFEQVEAEFHRIPEKVHVSIETLSQQNLVIMGVLQEVAAGIKQINDQREEIAQLKREIQELRLQLFSISQQNVSNASGESTPAQWKPPIPLETRSSSGRSGRGGKPPKSTEETLAELAAAINNSGTVPEEQAKEEEPPTVHSEAADEPKISDDKPSVSLPKNVDRQQLADIIEELRANEPQKEDVIVAEKVEDVTASEAAFLLERSYTPPSSADDNSNLSRVNSRTSKHQPDNKRWWQFWK